MDAARNVSQIDLPAFEVVVFARAFVQEENVVDCVFPPRAKFNRVVRQAQLFFAFAQRFIHLFTFGNVFLDRQKIGDFAAFVEDRRDGGVLPVGLAVLLFVQKFALPDAAAGNRLP